MEWEKLLGSERLGDSRYEQKAAASRPHSQCIELPPIGAGAVLECASGLVKNRRITA